MRCKAIKWRKYYFMSGTNFARSTLGEDYGYVAKESNKKGRGKNLDRRIKSNKHGTRENQSWLELREKYQVAEIK